jgi:hypothetical protein
MDSIEPPSSNVSWEKRYVKMVSVAPAELLNEVRERLAALLQID